jgi:hypothetical protein
MKAISCVAALLVTLALSGCGGPSTPYDAAADKAEIQDVIRSAWQAESVGDESLACLYFTESFIEEQNLFWEARIPGGLTHGKNCATGRGNHPYLRLVNVPGGFDDDTMRFAWTRVSPKAGTATAQPILPGPLRCLSRTDCKVVISLVIHLVDKEGGGWLIDDLDASSCEVGGGCVPLTNREVV